LFFFSNWILPLNSKHFLVWEKNLKLQKIMKNKWQKVNNHPLLGEVHVAVPGYRLLFCQKTRTRHLLAGAGGTRQALLGTQQRVPRKNI
jgi:hypothetical protein